MGEHSCEVCGAPRHEYDYACTSCKRMLDCVDMRGGFDREARLAAMKVSWDPSPGAFRCYYTGARLVRDDHSDPMYTTFEHHAPGDEASVVVSCALVNAMKSAMSEDEFIEVVRALAKRLDAEPFDETLIDVKHWKR